jgi:hypothetical protein
VYCHIENPRNNLQMNTVIEGMKCINLDEGVPSTTRSPTIYHLEDTHVSQLSYDHHRNTMQRAFAECVKYAQIDRVRAKPRPLFICAACQHSKHVRKYRTSKSKKDRPISRFDVARMLNSAEFGTNHTDALINAPGDKQ